MDINPIALNFVDRLNNFECDLEGDPSWVLLFSNGKRKWYYLVISLYNGTYYINSAINGYHGILSIEVSANGAQKGNAWSNKPNQDLYPEEQKIWIETLQFANSYLNEVSKNWYATYLNLTKKFPYKYRKGVLFQNVVWHQVNDIQKVGDQLGKIKLAEFLKIVESQKFRGYDIGKVTNFTAAQYYEYCKIAYKSCGTIKAVSLNGLNGKELYKRFADGRHEGLLEIDDNSPEEFAQWLEGKHPKYYGGGHPWEILRGGNTTHISMRVSKDRYSDKNQFEISLEGSAHNRLAEVIRIFLGLIKAKLPVKLDGLVDIRKRLLGQDLIGIVPEFNSLHRANQTFENKKVFDVMYFADLGKNRKKIINCISWEVLPCLKPKE